MSGALLLPWGIALWVDFLLIILAIAAVRPPLNRLATAAFAVGWMIMLTLLVHAFSTPGNVIWHVPGLGWMMTLQGLMKGALFAGRLTAVILFGTAITLSIGPLEAIRAAESLASPLARMRVPVGSIALVFGLSLRFVPTLFEEAITLRKALISRGWSPGKDVVARVKAWIPLFIPILASGLRRSDDVAETLVLRGFTPSSIRRGVPGHSWSWRETAVLLLALLPLFLLTVQRG